MRLLFYSTDICLPAPMWRTFDIFATIIGTTDNVFEEPEKVAAQFTAQDEPAAVSYTHLTLPTKA